jgi:hypothetical protein
MNKCPQRRKDFHIFIGAGPQEKTWDQPEQSHIDGLCTRTLNFDGFVKTTIAGMDIILATDPYRPARALSVNVGVRLGPTF